MYKFASPYSGSATWDAIPLVALDTETTGLSGRDRIVEISLVLLEGRKVLESFTSLVNPQMPIPHKAYEVHGIFDEDVDDAPLFDDILPNVVSFLRKGAWVAHNLPFDMRMLKNHIPHQKWPVGIPTLCTMQMAKKRGHTSTKLQALAAHYRIDAGTAHTAEDDAKTAGLLVHELARGLRIEDHYSRASEEWL